MSCIIFVSDVIFVFFIKLLLFSLDYNLDVRALSKSKQNVFRMKPMLYSFDTCKFSNVLIQHSQESWVQVVLHLGPLFK